jgi:uncharacterized protein
LPKKAKPLIIVLMAVEKQIEALSSDPILSEMVKRLVREFQPDKLYLFGSRATGTANESSDYDLLIVMPELKEPGRHLAARAYELLSNLGVAKDILFTSKEKFERRKTVMNTLAEIATTDGMELYAA